MMEKRDSVSTISIKDEIIEKSQPGADFETAITATGFGKFNFLLVLTAIPSILTSQFETSSLAFVFPAAFCDLKLNFEDRGIVNAVIFAGMILSCFIWGSLVDIFGRRKILIVSHFLDCIFVLMTTFSSKFVMLLAAKFMGGFIINGPSMALAPYLSEFHCTIYRSRVPLLLGFLYSGANLILPLIAWFILPLEINWSLWGFEFHAWNLFLLICAFPAFTSGIFFLLMPETPKYLMTKGNNAKALKVLQKVYNLNTGMPKSDYPINKLVVERQQKQEKTTIRGAWQQISPLFSSKYAINLVLVCSLTMLLMMCINSLRLWLPEIFQILNDYESRNNETSPSFCTMLQSMQTVKVEQEVCFVNFDNLSVYTNSGIIAFSTLCGYIIAAFSVNRLGKKTILTILGLISSLSVAIIYFAPNSISALILLCIHIMSSCICIDVVISVIIDLFPTYLRASALSLAIMCGRIGSLFGNLIFPILLQAGCGPPFFTLGAIIFGCTVLSFFLPNTNLKALE